VVETIFFGIMQFAAWLTHKFVFIPSLSKHLEPIKAFKLSYPIFVRNNRSEFAVVIPFYNEKKRFPQSEFLDFASKNNEYLFILVDDGSEDELVSELKVQLTSNSNQNIIISRLEKNSGKATALFCGFQIAIERQIEYIGFLDADFSATLFELEKLFKIAASQTNIDVVAGARVRNESNVIQATIVRMFLGFLFSSVVKYYLRLNLNDPQCGAKVFKNTNIFRKIVKTPPINPWLADIQLLLPISKSGGQILEVTLESWIHVQESKFRVLNGFCALKDLRKIKQNSLVFIGDHIDEIF
jgi:dolichyl-phosphate beta-glucosyltransferase